MKENPMETLSNRDEILAQWKVAKTTLDTAKADEATLRDQVVAAFSDVTDEMHSGTETVDIGWGHELKIVHSLRYELDKANDYEKTDKALDEIEATLGEEVGALLVDRLVKRKLELSISEYKKLPPKAKKIIDKVLTIKPGSKSVELKPVNGTVSGS
jgi:hypothetical protein